MRALLVLLLLAPLVGVSPVQAAEAFAIPSITDGETWTFETTVQYDGEVHPGRGRVFAWHAMGMMNDSYGVARATALATHRFGDSTEERWLFVDAGLRQPFATSTLRGEARSQALGFPAAHLVEESATAARTISYVAYLDPLTFLTGREFVAGETFVISSLPTAAASPSPAGARAAGWTQEGWRIDVAFGSGSSMALFYAEGSAAPVLVEWRYAFGGEVVERWTLASTQRGPSPLAPEGYVPPPPATERAGALTAPFTRDGPSEAFVAGAPLGKAVAAARADPRVAGWLKARPDAYVASAAFAIGEMVIWRVKFHDADAALTVEVALVQHSPAPGVVRALEARAASAWVPPFSALEGRWLACAAELARHLKVTPVSGSFSVTGASELECTLEGATSRTRDAVAWDLRARVGSATTTARLTIVGTSAGWTAWTVGSDAESRTLVLAPPVRL